jgi:UDP-N-acetylmuramoyl-tripeptide--D-alanyl-D-alanine ligase
MGGLGNKAKDVKLERSINYMGGEAPNLNPALLQTEVANFVIDSRDVQAGNVFFALSQPDYRNNGFNGEFEDATKYAAAAFEKGAVAAVLRRDRYQEHKADLEQFRDRLIFVDDTIAAFQRLAKGIYDDWNKPVVAVTGSAGKTSAKELTAHLLESSGRKVLKNIKNFNNGLGLPLTVMHLASDPSYDVAVLEMGMSTPMNEIQRLCRITPPDVAIELNVLPVHLEHLGSIENIAKAKAELIEGMKEGGTAVLNADDPRVLSMHALAKGDVVTYGLENPADVTAGDIHFDRFGETRFRLTINGESAEVTFPLNGRHNIMNALAAAAVGTVFGIGVEEIAASLATIKPPPQRGEVLHFADGFTVINDSYNSNPDALLSMVDTLVEGAVGAKRRVVIAGEMLELGGEANTIHHSVGERIADQRVDLLIGVRGLAKTMVEGARSKGLTAQFAEDSAAAADLAAALIRPGDVVLVKGSRGVRTEKVVEKLLEKFSLEEGEAAKR